MHAPIGPGSVISNLILEAKCQIVQEAAGYGTLDGYCFLYTALAGFRCRQGEIDDLKGMIALLVASLKHLNFKYGCNEDGTPSDWNPWVESREFITQAEAMLKGEKEL